MTRDEILKELLTINMKILEAHTYHHSEGFDSKILEATGMVIALREKIGADGIIEILEDVKNDVQKQDIEKELLSYQRLDRILNNAYDTGNRSVLWSAYENYLDGL